MTGKGWGKRSGEKAKGGRNKEVRLDFFLEEVRKK